MILYPNQKKTLLCFANNNYYISQNRLVEQAKDIRVFNYIISIKDTDLKNKEKYKDFWKQHNVFINNNKRGYGYWIWKSYLTLITLREMNDNDILIYIDSGCEINKYGLKRLIDYIKIVNNSDTGILTFHLNELTNIKWCKMDVIKELDAFEYIDNGQILTGLYIIRKCKHSLNIIEKWYNTMCNYHMIDDSPSIEKNGLMFSEHRHDQSVFSLLCYKMGAEILPDETFYHPNWKTGINSPIWAVRNRSPTSYVSYFLG